MTKMAEDTQENYDICMNGNCEACPSYPGDGVEGLYCARRPSEDPVERKGCNCPECPVWIDGGLSQQYYCARSE